jgi:putative spermidine/putrescine transport system ATP-binding protein
VSGDVCWKGKSLVEQNLVERRQGFFFQGGSLFPHLNVLENVSFPLNHFFPYRDWSTALKNERAKKMLELFGAGDLVSRQVVGLSGGERSRVALAQATVFEPRVLFLDEPFAALDEASRLRVIDALKQQDWMRQAVVFLVSHDAEGALLLSTRQVLWPQSTGLETEKAVVELEI